MKIEQLYDKYKQFPNVQTDTRKLVAGEMYFALKGGNFNGNLFAKQALEQGAAYAIVDEKEFANDEKTILVDDVLTTLQQLAHYHRMQFNIPFIAITGSNGKTTTKELIHTVLNSKFKTYTTEGNLNNHIGIPLTILKIKQDAQIAVIEMGANHLHEIEAYCTIAAPTHGLITNCGKAHLEGFGSLDGVKKAKGELFDFLRTQNDATVFIMNDFDYLCTMSFGIKNIKTYGTKNAETVGTASLNNDLLTVNLNNGTIINTQLIGDYNLPNVLAAVSLGTYFNIDMGTIKKSIENYAPSNSRSQLIIKDSNHIILDAYNANPSSMQLAIENFTKIEAENKILILGAMAEMGQESVAEHQQLIQHIKKYSWLDVILVGKEFLPFQQEFKVFKHSAEAAEWYKNNQPSHAYILVKGSRSSKMELVIA
ncbi:MAG: UDP-N-acetylmuramoyl-tripeptide--D-alanyl-D-alanine ligase [Bacteroidia bacterium]|nr:MAG: UDP-N-acetylmuramoyl-tripeptide--D-alanyl-D-alanine ligase [Bacteroidia bacterium]